MLKAKVNNIPDKSPNDAALKRSVAREPISIFSRIKSASGKEEKKKLNQLLATLRESLPKGFKIGAAIGEGNCFFDSVAQGLNELKSKDMITNGKSFNVKTLREDCANCANKYKDKIIQDAEQGGYSVIRKNVVAGGFMQDPLTGKDVIEEDDTFNKYLADIKNMGMENGHISIWGRLDIEGKIICEKYKVQIKVIELRDEQVGGVHVTTGEQGEGSDVIHIVNYRNHFVPLLSNLKEDIKEGKEVFREEVYGEKRTEKNGVENQEVRQAIMNSVALPVKVPQNSEESNKVLDKSSNSRSTKNPDSEEKDNSLRVLLLSGATSRECSKKHTRQVKGK